MDTDDPTTILVVDDDADWRKSLCKTLVSSYCVQTAANGADALVLARKIRPALIILDVMMPGGMDGFTALCELQKDSNTRLIPVIIFSEVNALSGMEFSVQVLKEHLAVAPAAIIEKPASPEALLAAVTRVLRRKA